MKQTLLEMVQRILEAVDGQMVDSISDTREAVQVANCIKETYQHLLYTRDIKVNNNLVQLHSASDVARPTTLYFNDNVYQLDMLKYFDKSNNRYVDLTWLDPEEFLERSINMNPTKPNVMNCIDKSSGVRYNVYTDKAPQYYTSFNDSEIVCDAFNEKDGQTLMEEYTVAYGVVVPEFKIEDTFVPDLAPQHFSLLLASARVQAAYELNREIDQVTNDRARKELVTADKHAQRVKGLDTTLWKNRQRTGRRIM